MQSDISCLTQAMYFEAGNQGHDGQIAVAWVIENRKNEYKLNNYCETVFQKIDGKPQFLWIRPKQPTKKQTIEYRNWIKIKALATDFLKNKYRYPDITFGALFFHADYVKPIWRHRKEKTIKVGRHIFYRNPYETINKKNGSNN